jgi:NADH dehydrogenase
MQMGRHAAANVLRQLEGKPTEPFWYLDKGSLATIGRNAGIADIKGVQFGGSLAWLAWALIHLFFLVGFRNRTLVFLQWAWEYVFYTRGARLISEIPRSNTSTTARLGTGPHELTGKSEQATVSSRAS